VAQTTVLIGVHPMRYIKPLSHRVNPSLIEGYLKKTEAKKVKKRVNLVLIRVNSWLI